MVNPVKADFLGPQATEIKADSRGAEEKFTDPPRGSDLIISLGGIQYSSLLTLTASRIIDCGAGNPGKVQKFLPRSVENYGLIRLRIERVKKNCSARVA